MSVGGDLLLDSIDLSLEGGEHVVVVGRNGGGKSCLLRALAGEPAPPHTGQIQWQRSTRVQYLAQDPVLDASRTLRQEAAESLAPLRDLPAQLGDVAEQLAVASGTQQQRLLRRYEQIERHIQTHDAYGLDHRIDAMLAGLGLGAAEYDIPVGSLSGGQRGRLALAKLLLAEPDAILLDEPTNHLDLAGRQWLEQFLASYSGSVMVVSHDRYLIDRVADKIYELEGGQLIEYPGNYGRYLEVRAQRRISQSRAYAKQQEAIKREQKFIDRYRSGQRARQARGREKRLQRMVHTQGLDRPVEPDPINIRLCPKVRSGDIVLSAENISKAYGERVLFEQFGIVIKRGDRIGIIGPNGIGKTTLVRCLLGEDSLDGGTARTGAQVEVGFYRQSHEHIDGNQSVVAYLRRAMPEVSEQKVRDTAAAFLFSDDEQDKSLSVLSGGERSRAVLAALLTKGHNLLVLDEPTNHLDIPSVERVEEALKQFTASSRQDRHQGTLVLISHDRMLLDRLVDRLIVFEAQGCVRLFLGNYADYENQALAVESPTPKHRSARGRSGSAKRRSGAVPRRPKAALGLAELERQIMQIETEISDIDQQLADTSTYGDGQRIKALRHQRAELDDQRQPLEAEWARRVEDS